MTYDDLTACPCPTEFLSFEFMVLVHPLPPYFFVEVPFPLPPPAVDGRAGASLLAEDGRLRTKSPFFPGWPFSFPPFTPFDGLAPGAPAALGRAPGPALGRAPPSRGDGLGESVFGPAAVITVFRPPAAAVPSRGDLPSLGDFDGALFSAPVN